MNPKITVSESGDLSFIRAAIGTLQNAKVYVGVPEKTAQRDNAKGGITNASLMYIQTNGSTLRGIPPRPVIEPAIEANKEMITAQLAKVAEAEFDGNVDAAKAELTQTGILGANSAKRWFTDPRNGWAPNAPSTIARKGSDRPLIDTGELRRSITWVSEI